jgi:putative transposase
MDVALQSRAEQLADEMAGQARTVEDLNELMRRMMKTALERMLNTEMDVHLGRKASAPREGVVGASAEPQLVGKYQRHVPGFDEKILAMYAKGMTTRDRGLWRRSGRSSISTALSCMCAAPAAVFRSIRCTWRWA